MASKMISSGKVQLSPAMVSILAKAEVSGL
jgi:hypothetical protein